MGSRGEVSNRADHSHPKRHDTCAPTATRLGGTCGPITGALVARNAEGRSQAFSPDTTSLPQRGSRLSSLVRGATGNNHGALHRATMALHGHGVARGSRGSGRKNRLVGAPTDLFERGLWLGASRNDPTEVAGRVLAGSQATARHARACHASSFSATRSRWSVTFIRFPTNSAARSPCSAPTAFVTMSRMFLAPNVSRTFSSDFLRWTFR